MGVHVWRDGSGLNGVHEDLHMGGVLALRVVHLHGYTKKRVAVLL